MLEPEVKVMSLCPLPARRRREVVVEAALRDVVVRLALAARMLVTLPLAKVVS
jgi:hypothetical protein